MTQEEKFKEAKRLYETANADQRYVLESLFPELKESEDERIKKALINFLKSPFVNESITDEKVAPWIAWLEKQGESLNMDIDIESMTEAYEQRLINKCNGVRNSPLVNMCVAAFKHGVKNILNELHLKQGEQKETLCDKCKKAQPSHSCQDVTELGRCALEKQGEQKPDDKVEPKFRIGDWVVRNGETLQISGIDTVLDGTFHYWFTKGTWISSKKMENAMLWTIQDAKDGDVLNSPAHRLIWIYKDNEHYHVCVNMNYVTENVATDGLISIPNDAYPATNDERTILLSNLEKSGYKWDAEKKELNKIEQKPAAWSEEDESLCMQIEGVLSVCRTKNLLSFDLYKKMCDLLKSIKDRVQPKQEWSEEDKRKIDRIYSILRQASDTHAFSTSCRLIGDKECIELQDFLKSLIPQSHWRPSERQKEALLWCVVHLGGADKQTLGELLEELNKL